MKPPSAQPHSSQAMYAAIQQVVAAIPPGQVMSYGQVARAAGYPRHARMVARAMRSASATLPWFRVVNHLGAVSARGLDGEDDLQRLLLTEEGVEFDSRGRIDLVRFGATGST